jgi:hypothetical protein
MQRRPPTPRFGVTVPSLLDIREKRDTEKEREMQRLRLKSRFEPTIVLDGIKKAKVDHGNVAHHPQT